MNVRCKFKCIRISENSGGAFEVAFVPVTSGSQENENFWRWTPGGELRLSGIKKEVAAAFKVDQDYYLDLTPAPPAQG